MTYPHPPLLTPHFRNLDNFPSSASYSTPLPSSPTIWHSRVLQLSNLLRKFNKYCEIYTFGLITSFAAITHLFFFRKDDKRYVLSCFHDKRYVLDDGIYILSYFHKNSVTICNN